MRIVRFIDTKQKSEFSTTLYRHRRSLDQRNQLPPSVMADGTLVDVYIDITGAKEISEMNARHKKSTLPKQGAKD